MADSAALSATLEDYLEAISRLIAKKGRARVLDIASALSVHKSTVSAALKSLAEKKLVNYRPYEAATLTPKGRKAAQDVIRRHELIRRFLVEVLLVEKHVAEENACRMEHVLDNEVLERLRLFAEFVKECPRAGDDWLEAFQYYFQHGGETMKRRAEVEQWLKDFRAKLQQQEQEERSEKAMPTLDQLEPGQKGKIIRVGSVGALRRRIVDMGVVRGTPVEVVKVAPLGDPIEIKVKGYNLSLRKQEAAAITVEPE